MNQYAPPEHGKTAFNCPYCNAFARQDRYQAFQGTHNLQNQNSNIELAVAVFEVHN